MRKVCLDKTINLTRAIMNRDVNVPSFIEVETGFVGMDRFRFVNSKTELPIENIGLAILSYKNAVEQFSFTKVDIDEQTGEKISTPVFDPLISTGSYISDFLQTISPDALNWYFNANGMMKLNYINGKVQFSNPSDYKQCKSYSEEGLDIREQTVREAYSQAVKGYVAETLESSDDSENLEADLQAFIEEDAKNFEDGMEELKLQSTMLVVNQNSKNQEQDSSQTQVSTDNLNNSNIDVIDVSQ